MEQCTTYSTTNKAFSRLSYTLHHRRANKVKNSQVEVIQPQPQTKPSTKWTYKNTPLVVKK